MKLERQQRVKDMTEGKPIVLILLFAVPIFLGNIFQQFYNIVDTVIAGRYLGDESLAAIGATSAIYSLVLCLVNGMNNGYAILVARAFGEKNEEKVKDSVGLMLVLNIISIVLVTILSVLFIGPLLKVLHTPEEIYAQAYSYIIIILIGLGITIFYNMEAAVLRALGNSMTPLVYLIIASCINVALDLVLIVIFKMGVEGLALATVIAQLISVILCLYHIKKNYPILKLHRGNYKFEKEAFAEMFTTGLSMGLMLSIFSIGTVILQSAINGLGTLTITAHLAARKVFDIFNLPLGTISNANATFVSQNFGAKKYERVREGIRKSCVLGILWGVIANVIVFFGAEQLVEFMTSSKERYVVETAARYLHINLPFFLVLAVLYILRTSLQGMGRKITPLVSSGLELVGKVIATLALIPVIGYLGVCVVEPATWVACTIWLAFSYYFAIRNYKTTSRGKNKKRFNHNACPKRIKYSEEDCTL